MHMGVVLVCLHHMHAWYPRRPEEGTGSPEIGVTDGCELPCRCWESNPSPLQKQQVLLTAEPTLQSFTLFFYMGPPTEPGAHRFA